MKKLELLLPPPVITLCSGLFMWLLAKLLPTLSLNWPYRTELGVLMILIGLAIGLSGVREVVKAKTTMNPKQPGDASRLVSSGIYKYSRNPMYLGLLCLLTAWLLYLSNPVSLIGILVFVLYITRFQIIPEERVLEEKFSGVFLSYKKQTRRWF